MRKLYTGIILLFITAGTHAQVKGYLIDSTSKKPIEHAVVGLVVKTNATDTTYAFTDDKGQFRFDVVPSSNFSIIIRHLGYRTVAKFVPVNKQEKTIDLGNFFLTYDAKLLQEVVVEAPAIQVKEDTIEYRADAFKVKEGAVVEDLLKKLPGVQVDKDGNVTAQGKSVSRVKVNGKDFFGGDVKTATKELPANIVDKIQVIDDYGDQATVSGIKDGDPDKILNIEIKKDKNRGFFGRVTGGYGTEDRYQASFNGNYFQNNTQLSAIGNINNTNTSLFNFSGGGNRGATSMMRQGMSVMTDMGGMGQMNNMMQNGTSFGGTSNSGGITASNSFGFNYRDQWSKRISVYGSYSYNHRNTGQEQNSFETNNTTGFYNNQDQHSLTTGNSHRFTFNFEYQVDSFNYLKISPAINYSGSEGDSRSAFNYTKISDGTKGSDGSNKNINNSKAPNLQATILYNHRFRKRGRNFSASITLGTSENNSEQNVTNLNYIYTPPFPGPRNTFQYVDQENNNHNYGVRFTYSEPLNKYRSLDFSYSHNLSYARNNRQTYNVDSATQAKTLNNFLSNDYENDFYNNRIGLSMRTTKKKYNYTVGISVQPVNLQGNSITKDSAYKTIRRASVFPIARFVYNFNRTKSLNLAYNGNATQPSFSQLQPVQDLSNPQNSSIGNPNLKPSINHNINVSFNNFNFVTGKVLFTNLTFSTIRNQIVNKTAKRDQSGSTISIPENVNGYYNVLGFYAYSRPYKNRKYVITLNGSLNYNHNINLTDSVLITGTNTFIQNLDRNEIKGNNWIISQGVNFEFNYKEILELGTGISYSLNDNKYKSGTTAKNPSNFQNTSSNAWTFSSNMNFNITKTLVLKYDFDYTINSGLANSVSRNLAIMNASIEKQLFKKKNGLIRFAAFDLFKQNTNVSRNVSGNSIFDTRTNRLTRYFMLSFTYRLQRFAGQNIQQRGVDFRKMGPPPAGAPNF